MLHTVNKSPTERNTLESCLKHLKKGCAVLLIEDKILARSPPDSAIKLEVKRCLGLSATVQCVFWWDSA